MGIGKDTHGRRRKYTARDNFSTQSFPLYRKMRLLYFFIVKLSQFAYITFEQQEMAKLDFQNILHFFFFFFVKNKKIFQLNFWTASFRKKWIQLNYGAIL